MTDDLKHDRQSCSKLLNVRILYLPPATVAAAHFIGPDPEHVTLDQIAAFARAHDLARIKPDLRLYGFNHPNPVDDTGAHGYEFWLTIPDDLAVPAPLTKKRFEGGLYAAHAIQMDDFHEWEWLSAWVEQNGEYVYRGNGSPENMFDSLEEHLNVFTHLQTPGALRPAQLDLLVPVRHRSQS
ncbi:effector binding domain-containing protein [Chitiniphilus shinanonensis]|uniref:effector binding domain-containing protein n=1 Tax=Chitiniphilus shinanonensis TaxID=553088 RepID=UPI00302E3472